MSEFLKIDGTDVCDRHGSYRYTAHKVGGNIIGQVCPECMKEGQAKANRSMLEFEAQSKLIERIARLEKAGVPPLFLNSRFDNYQPVNDAAAKNARIIQSYGGAFDHILAGSLVKGLILTGVSGTGKTHLSCALIDLLMQNGYSAMYASTPTLLWQLRDASMGRYETSLSHLLGKYTTPHLLVLDEYGVNTTNDKDYQLLYSVIDARYQRNLPTLLATNIPQATLELELDARFLERIRGNGGPVLGFNWSTYRMSAK